MRIKRSVGQGAAVCLVGLDDEGWGEVEVRGGEGSVDAGWEGESRLPVQVRTGRCRWSHARRPCFDFAPHAAQKGSERGGHVAVIRATACGLAANGSATL